MELEPSTQTRIDTWLKGNFDKETKAEILKLQESDPKALRDAFYTDLAFGTGGLRGLMGVGANRMNNYTVRRATLGLARYLKKSNQKQPMKVVIGYDSRHHSEAFAEETARVFAAQGIEVFLLSELRPTPFVSFACRHLRCNAAVMITASHNPAVYNGYKVYWSDGAQVVSPHDKGIMNEVLAIQSYDSIPVMRFFGCEESISFSVGNFRDKGFKGVSSPDLRSFFTCFSTRLRMFFGMGCLPLFIKNLWGK